jgi:hypothetical protein
MAGSAFGKFDFLQLFGGGSRDACLFEGKDSKVDLSAFCHEVHGVDLSQGEQFFVSLQDGRRRSGEQLSPLGKACHVRSCELDATLLLKVWASRDPGATCESFDGLDSTVSTAFVGGQRLCGELRINLQRLVLQCQDSLLYQSWVALESPSSTPASVATSGLGEESGALDLKLLEGGPRQMNLNQPRVCLTVCKTADLSASGKLHLSFEAPQELRMSHWSALLKSQSQHYVMSKTLHLQALQLQVGECSDLAGERRMDSPEVEAAQGRVKDQTFEIEELHRQITQVEAKTRERKLSEVPLSPAEQDTPRRARVEQQLAEAERFQQVASRMSSGGTSLVEPGFGDHSMRSEAAELAAQQLRDDNMKQQAELDGLRAELVKVREEANSKIDAANERIRLLRRDRDDAREDSERLKLDSRQLEGQNEQLSEENLQLAEQRQALLRIVEDLHQTTVVAGLDEGTRRSVDSIKASIMANFSIC